MKKIKKAPKKYKKKNVTKKGVSDKERLSKLKKFQKIMGWESGYIYIIRCGDTNYYKIGLTSISPKHRMQDMLVSTPFELTVECFIKSVEYKEIEKRVHKHFIDYHHRGEWFEFSEEKLEEVKIWLKKQES